MARPERDDNAHPRLRAPGAGMIRLTRLNRTGVFVGALVLGLAGLFLPGAWGGLLLAVIVIGMGLLMRATWAVTPPPLRLARMIILLLLALIAYTKLSP